METEEEQKAKDKEKSVGDPASSKGGRYDLSSLKTRARYDLASRATRVRYDLISEGRQV